MKTFLLLILTGVLTVIYLSGGLGEYNGFAETGLVICVAILFGLIVLDLIKRFIK